MKLNKYFLILILSFPFFFGFYSQNIDQPDNLVIQNGEELYLSNTLVIKFKNDLNGNIINLKNSLKLNPVLGKLNILKLEKIFSDNKFSASNSLSKIYKLDYSDKIDPKELAKKLKEEPNIEYAEPHYIYKVDFIPNDPGLSQQYYIQKCQLISAWDNSKGDSSIVIGIVDTGIYWNHPDLNANIWTNKNEIPNNGIDDDNNGYIDDVRGWDLGGTNGTPDNNPSEDRPDHGTLVGGIASASTNNNLGIAGAGYKCKIMAVKTSRDDMRDPSSGKPYIIYGFEGIKYAADNGAKIINCSWGGGGYSAFGQEIINYATSLGSLVIAAAGNENNSGDHYPSDYKNCFSVAATEESDVKANYSNYNFNVDVSAPGTGVYSTWDQNGYLYASGTSLSSPLVAGIAGLVAAKYPSYTPEQIGEKIRVSCDDIYALNPNYQYLLGKGRVNALRALQENDIRSARILNFTFNDNPPLGNGNGVFEPSESADIVINAKNILSQTQNLTLTMSSLTSGVSVVNSSFAAGSKQTGEVFNNSTKPFRISASSTLGNDIEVKLLLTITDGQYSDFQVIKFTANPSYIQSNNSQVDITIGSRGNLGFNDYPSNAKGLGFKYANSSNLLFEGALIIGTGPTKISDRARGINASVQNQDFVLIEPIKLFRPGTKSDIQTISSFNDDGAGTNKIGIKTVLTTYQFSEDPNTDYILLHYKFINQSPNNISNFHAGLFFDWDLIASTGLDDYAGWENSEKFGYVYNVLRSTPYYMGCGLVSDTKYNFRAILNAGGDGGWGIYDGFLDGEKWEALSGGLNKLTAGAGDISMVVAAGPYNILQNDTLNIVFAIAGGDTLSSLKDHIVNAKIKWNQILTKVETTENLPLEYSLSQNYPNPFNPTTIINYEIPTSPSIPLLQEEGRRERSVSLKIYDILGREIETLVNEEQPAGKYSIEWNATKYSSGIYYYELRAGDFHSIKKMLLIK